MKEGWKYVKFKEIFPIKMGKTPPRGDSSSWDIKKETQNRWVSIADISQNEGEYIIDTKEYISDSAAAKIHKVTKGSLLMSFKLSIGRMAFAGADLYTNEAIIEIPNNDSYCLRFIYHYLLSYDWSSLTEGNEKVKGATLNKTSIGNIELPIIPYSEQQRIVEYLDSTFAEIDALKAKAAEEVTNAKAMFDAALREEMTPKEGWEEKKMTDICSIKSKLVDPRDEKYQNLLHVGGANIASKSDILVNLLTAKQEKLESGKFYFEPDVVLYNKIRPYLIKVARPDFRGLCSADMYPLTPEPTISKDYLYYILISEDFTSYAILGSSRAGMPKVNREHLFAYKCIIPSLDQQRIIVARLDTLRSLLTELEQKYAKIAAECDAVKQAILRETFE